MTPFIGQMMMFGGNFAPRGWAFCSGQLLSIAENTALFSILGTTYGGDGRTSFGLPDLRGRVPVHAGNGPGLTDRRLGAKAGSETNRMTQGQMPSHNHSLASVTVRVPVSEEDANQDEASGQYLANGTFYHNQPDGTYGAGPLPLTGNMSSVGNSNDINNIMPFQAVHYIIALQGTFPSRN